MYSIASIDLLLDNYFLLYESILPGDAGRTNLNGSPIESPAILKADIDNAILSLGEWWAECLEAMDSLYSDGLDPRTLFYDSVIHYRKLSKHQKAIVKYHFGVDLTYEPKYLYEIGRILLAQSHSMMLRFLNHGITQRDWRLVSNLVESLSFIGEK